MECCEVGRVRFRPFGWSEVNHDHRREDILKSGTRAMAEGTLPEMKGKVEEAAEKLTDSPKLEAEGTAEKITG
jgi:hypothetical protein